MTDWTVQRWTRYGHDRLYAATAGGTALGYLDLKTNTLQPAQSDDLPLLTEAIASYYRAREPVSGRHATNEPQRPAEHIYLPRHEVVDWADVGAAKAGAAAREQAVALRKAAPVRTFVTGFLDLKTDERAWRIGAAGERAVGAQLAKLGPEWRVIHAVQVSAKGTDIDHLVIGPAGVFTINTKHHPDGSVWVAGNTFMVNGHHTHYVNASRSEARKAMRLLGQAAGRPVEVRAIITVMGAQRGFTVKEQPADVHVLTRRTVRRYLRKQPDRLTPHEVDALYQLACRSTTWLPAA